MERWSIQPEPEEEDDEMEEGISVFAQGNLRPEFSGFGGPPRYSSDEDGSSKKTKNIKKGETKELSEEEVQKVGCTDFSTIKFSRIFCLFLLFWPYLEYAT